jgi:hypothetical protein
MPDQSDNIEDVIEAIIHRNDIIRAAWSQSHGWAPPEAADLLAKSRLDRQVSLSHCLKMWMPPHTADNEEGRLILAWANLGAAVEGTMKTCLSIFLGDYSQRPVTRGRKQTPLEPDELSLEELRHFFKKEPVWATECEDWDQWVGHIQQRRNAIHAYKDRDIGTFEEFRGDVRRYRELIIDLDRAPYPDYD